MALNYYIFTDFNRILLLVEIKKYEEVTILKKIIRYSIIFLLLTSLTCSASTLNNHSTKEYNWYYLWRIGAPPDSPKESKNFHFKYNTFYIGDTSKKELYLTFDEGYENGNTNRILSILKANNVPAAFFVVKPYIEDNPQIIQRMVNEGHLVCNHSSHHPSMASIKDETKFSSEFKEVEESFKEVTGKEMPKYFRPPMGKYSEESLSRTEALGYKTIFWSFAYKDWLVNEQPTPSFGKNKILSRCSNGTIILLHAVSNTNTEILDDVIKTLKADGYEFKSLDQLPANVVNP